ncbi:DNA polymerase eta isoform X2 [Mangifera indica]|uniref:DNA polymerase eta isoform X2 n=1 Tax=Mangifera indica TaxID=29780 RepID=UPI001CFB8819|nr:DNA polymerase eta isoform X2 [Mangifera indica]
MPVAKPQSSDARIIAHVDMDCFYVQVEQRKQPHLRGLPTAVVQYNEWKGGALIAISYEARKYGVKRSMRGDEAKEACPHIELVQVPVARGKADLSTYRNAGSEVVSILARKGRCERASIDEVYLDLTDAAEAMLAETPPESLEVVDEEALKSHILGLESGDGVDAKSIVREWLCRSEADHRDKLLACGALIVAELRKQVLKETEFTCSAGVAHNKMLAKLASSMNKPAQQTVVPLASVKELLNLLPVKKMKQLGGKLGTSLQSELGVNTVGDLLKFSEIKLQELYGVNTGTWLWNIARGISGEEVQARLLPKSHGSGKSFPGPRALKTVASVQHWLNQLSDELSERLCSDLEQNKRIARTLTLHASAFRSGDTDSHKKFPSKSCPLRYGTAKIQEDSFNLFQAGLREYLGSYGVKTQGSHYNGWGITALSLSASKIVPTLSGTCSITKYFHGQDASNSSLKQSPATFTENTTLLSPSGSESYSELNPTEPQDEFPSEEVPLKLSVAGLGQQVERTDAYKEQDQSCCIIQQASCSFTPEISPSSCSGTESCSGLNQSKQQRDQAHSDDSRTKPVMTNLKRQEQNRNQLKDKGTSSILDFFKSQSLCSSWKQEHVESSQNANATASIGDYYSVSMQVQEPMENFLPETATNSGRSSSDQIQQTSEAWNYRIEEIDPTVIEELPPQIQDEIRAWLRPHKRPNMVKRSSSIADYFLPSKNR